MQTTANYVIMDFNVAITEAYNRIEKALDIKLGIQGYTIVHEQRHDEVFGSRYVVWSNNEDALRLLWDGKECRFALEVSHVLPLSSATLWDEMIIISYDQQNDNPSQIDMILKKILDSLD